MASHSKPLTHREQNEPAADQILVSPVVVGVFPTIVPAQHHLPWTAAVHVHDSRLARGSTNWFEELAVGFDSIAGAEADEFRCHELGSWKIRRQPFPGKETRGPAGYRNHGWRGRTLSPRAQISDRLAVGSDNGSPFDAGARRDGRGCPRIDRHFEEVAAIHIAAIRTRVRIVDDEPAIGS